MATTATVGSASSAGHPFVIASAIACVSRRSCPITDVTVFVVADFLVLSTICVFVNVASAAAADDDDDLTATASAAVVITAVTIAATTTLCNLCLTISSCARAMPC